MATRKESAADITITVGEEEVVVETLSITKNIDVETIYGSGQTLPGGYAINQVSYEGDMTLKGEKFDLEDKFFDGGVPKVADGITISHYDGTSTSFNDVIVTSEGYEMNSGETVETTFEFVAMSRSRDGDVEEDTSE